MQGRRLVAARVAWVVTTIAAGALLLAGVPLRYIQQLHNTGAGRLDPALYETTLQTLSLSAAGFAAYALALDLLLASGFLAAGVLIFARKSDEWPPLLFSHLLVMAGVAATGLAVALESLHPALRPAVESLRTYGIFGLFLFGFLFPDGRFVPRWSWLPALVWLVVSSAAEFFPGSAWDVETWPIAINVGLLVITVGSLPLATIYRYRRVSDPVQRQQTKWVVFSICAAILINLGSAMLSRFVPAFAGTGAAAVYFRLFSELINVLAFLLIPFAVGVAVLRFRLWDIDPVIYRTLVYGTLTLSVIGLCTLIVSVLSLLFQTSGNVLISLVATGVVVLLFQPLQSWLRRAINRLMYGERDNPYLVLSRLGERLEATLAPDAMLPAIAETLKDALRLPYVAIALDHEGTCTTAASAGLPVADTLVLPLSHQGELIGQLILGPRAPGDAFSASELRLLNDLARQIALAAHTQRLTVDLQRSRERLVTAREEERRRLRRDLHDGLGPALAAQTLKVGSARALYGRNHVAADTLLGELENDIEAALQDIRRLVYNLRPPALDELGLAGAIREQIARQFGGLAEAQSLAVVLDVPEQMPSLPAAVEVAAYRIVQEALANVVRHARARRCEIRLRLDPAPGLLTIEISDDGIGLPQSRTAGVGLASMRERAAELGGSCRIAARTGGGTMVLAQIPAPAPVES